jgi:hypothetical protein
MSTENEMPVAVAKALLDYKRLLSEEKWAAFKAAYHRARSSYSPEMALQVAERAIMKSVSNRPPA